MVYCYMKKNFMIMIFLYIKGGGYRNCRLVVFRIYSFIKKFIILEKKGKVILGGL